MIDGAPSERKNPKPPINGVDIARQLQRDSILEKPLGDERTSIIHQCNVSEDVAEKLARGGRENSHLLRMLRRSVAERNFSLAYLQYSDDIFAEDKDVAHTIRDVIGSEGADTIMFWTFAPYIFKALIEKGLTEKDAMKKILYWSKYGASAITDGRAERKNSSRNYVRKGTMLNLQGLDKYQRGIGNSCWVLDKDPHHISHQYTEQEAKIIADLLISEE